MSIQEAIEVLKIEADGILKLAERIDSSFDRMVDIIYESRGRVILAGIGKSGIVARKIAATLSSTGTRAIFLHPVEAMHGDLGIVSANDVFIALSKSGETDELNILLPSIRKVGCPIIAFTGNFDSTLARHSDIIIDVGVEKEACPMNLAPTTSTTAQLAMGDALAVVLIKKRHFTPTDFKKFHPGGNLGQRLSLTVSDIMLTGDAVPTIETGTGMEAALKVMDAKKLGVIFIQDKHGILEGILTDGDIRRLVVKNKSIYDLRIESVMIRKPKTVSVDMPLYDALNIMEENQITVLPALGRKGIIAGALHLHDILGKGSLKFAGL
ncbi:MAG: KpsF/GutQ family sugar-phosphate isomerase [Deltaproteobacteria bacterium]|nr:KpsF/GutQ family sugar-phosphate isomerase [Deltaproteobacteria bacterium]